MSAQETLYCTLDHGILSQSLVRNRILFMRRIPAGARPVARMAGHREPGRWRSWRGVDGRSSPHVSQEFSQPGRSQGRRNLPLNGIRTSEERPDTADNLVMLGKEWEMYFLEC